MTNHSKVQEHRQVIFIMTDSQRWDMVNAYRHTGLATPHLDRLADEGLRFDRAYTTQPVCQPARAGIFTGQFPSSCGSWTNSQGISNNVHHIGERLNRAGIETAYIGKWHLDGSDYFGLGRCPDGWDPDYWYDMHNYLDQLSESDRLDSRRADSMKERNYPAEFTFAYRCSERAIRYLHAKRDRSFFLALSYDEPHDPFICPSEYWQKYSNYTFPDNRNRLDPLTNKPAHHRVWAGDRLNRDPKPGDLKHQAFFGCNSFVDSEIGRVLETIRTMVPSATVIYTSDHGVMLGSHRLTGKGPAVYDEITRIPLIVSGPDIRRGIDTDVVSHVDLAPTIFDLLGVRQPESVFHGRSMLNRMSSAPQQLSSSLKEEATRKEDTNAAFIEFGRYEIDHDGFGGFQPLRAIVTKRYKLCLNLLTSDELYDMQTDPDEMENRIEDSSLSAVRDELHDRLLNHMNETRDPFRGYYWRCRDWRTDAAAPSWEDYGMTRQRVDDDYEQRQLDYDTGLTMKAPTRRKSVFKRTSKESKD